MFIASTEEAIAITSFPISLKGGDVSLRFFQIRSGSSSTVVLETVLYRRDKLLAVF